MSQIVGLPAAIVSGYRVLPFLLRRLILVLLYSLLFAAGAFMHNRGAGDVAMLFLLVGAIGTWWASGAWRILKVILLLVFVVVGH
ncbi:MULTISPECIES: hypothetical protein [Burkholderia cepacia complex]|uniref:hypothetical protein n=1 Tax=Burkholderia cepacia complex TaxID=87882 RepID=UPI00158A687D|nr:MULTISPECIES: hypothetical protein [Burkholderia cepacia complex]MCA8002827.1 hypothetical protein [Burkholderia metallica]MCA8022684.1 hypothetical protein [Burkholderia metallica]